jgi:AraC-like DNA-binding protein
LAVDYACRKSLAFLGVVGLGMLVQPTLGAALRFFIDFQALSGSVLSFELAASDAETSVIAFDLTSDAELAPFWHIDHLTTVANLLGQLPCDEPRPLRIELDRPAPEETRRRIAERLCCAVVDVADRSRLVYSRKALESPLRFPDRGAVALWRQAAERELAALPAPDAHSRVQRLISEEGRIIGRREVSRKLGVSERSLDRLLAREGVRFSELAESRRLERAKALLRAGRTVEHVAEAIGYSDARSFRRAFQRGEGLSPVAFKQTA